MKKVSVHMLAYNHGAFIEKAIQGVVMQKTDFEFELVIGEDCSTDNTREIIQRYEKMYPDIIRPIYHDDNVGMMGNYRLVFEACQGQYIAVIDGDDYWTDPNKLQIQADLLDQRQDIIITAHAVDFHYLDKKQIDKDVHQDNPQQFGLDYFIEKNTIDSVAMMFRAHVLEEKPDIWYKVPYGDYLLKVMCLQKGDCYFMKESMAVYNIQSESYVHKNEIGFLMQQVEYFILMKSYLPEKKEKFTQSVTETRFVLARQLLKDGQKDKCKKQFIDMYIEDESVSKLSSLTQYYVMVTKNSIRYMLSKVIPSLKDTNY